MLTSQPSRAHVRERGGPDLGAEPRSYADMIASSLAGQALFTYAPRGRPRPPRPVEAPSGAAADPGGARQRQGAAGHLRQGRRRSACAAR